MVAANKSTDLLVFYVFVFCFFLSQIERAGGGRAKTVPTELNYNFWAYLSNELLFSTVEGSFFFFKVDGF